MRRRPGSTPITRPCARRSRRAWPTTRRRPHGLSKRPSRSEPLRFHAAARLSTDKSRPCYLIRRRRNEPVDTFHFPRMSRFDKQRAGNFLHRSPFPPCKPSQALHAGIVQVANCDLVHVDLVHWRHSIFGFPPPPKTIIGNRCDVLRQTL